MGTHRDNSDIDLVIFGKLNEHELASLNTPLEELPTPYTFDIQIYDDITSNELKEHINKFGAILTEQ